jgi:hypothetical protein
MPNDVSLYLVGAWFCVGLVTSIGWALGSAIVSRLVR